MKNVLKAINEAISNGALVDGKLRFSGSKGTNADWTEAKDYFAFHRKHFLEAPIQGISDVKLGTTDDKWVIEITVTSDYQGGE